MNLRFLYDFFDLGQYFPYGNYPLPPEFHAYRGDCNTPGYCVDFTTFEGSVFAYEKCTPLRTVINKLAFTLSNAKIWVVDEDEKDVEAYQWVKDLFLQPNPLQVGRELLFTLDAYVKIFGEGFLVKNTSPLTGIPYTVWTVDPRHMFDESTGRWLNQTEMDQINAGWIYRNPYTRTEIRLKNEDVLHVKDANINLSFGKSHFRGRSRIEGLEKDIMNILVAKDATLSLNTDRGALGILSPDGKDAAGPIQYTPKDKQNLHDEFSRAYGITHGKSKQIITNKSAKWQNISFNTKDLMIYEGIKENVERVCEAYFFPYQLYGNTIYNNQDTAWKQLYQDAVIPSALVYEQKLTSWLGIENARVNFDFSHVEVLQQSEKEKNDAIKERTQTVRMLWQDGLATDDEYRMAAQLSDDFNPADNSRNNQNTGIDE